MSTDVMVHQEVLQWTNRSELLLSLSVVCVRQAMAVVNTRKMKFSPLKGSFSEKGLNEFLL